MKTHCINGHEYTPENTMTNKTSGKRLCRVCQKDSKKKSYLENTQVYKDRARKNREDNPKRYKDYELRRCFNMTLEQYEAMLVAQNHRCLGCGKHHTEEDKLVVDHDRTCCPRKRGTCGKCVRGLLCQTCNRVLGLLKDNFQTLRNLSEYLK